MLYTFSKLIKNKRFADYTQTIKEQVQNIFSLYTD